MNHKRKKPKSSRAGCLLCKPHKHQRAKDSEGAQTTQEKRQRKAEKVDEKSSDEFAEMMLVEREVAEQYVKGE